MTRSMSQRSRIAQMVTRRHDSWVEKRDPETAWLWVDYLRDYRRPTPGKTLVNLLKLAEIAGLYDEPRAPVYCGTSDI